MNRIILYTFSESTERKQLKKRRVDIDEEAGKLIIPGGRSVIYIEKKDGMEKLFTSSTPKVIINLGKDQISGLLRGEKCKEVVNGKTRYFALTPEMLVNLGEFDKENIEILKKVFPN